MVDQTRTRFLVMNFSKSQQVLRILCIYNNIHIRIGHISTHHFVTRAHFGFNSSGEIKGRLYSNQFNDQLNAQLVIAS